MASKRSKELCTTAKLAVNTRNEVVMVGQLGSFHDRRGEDWKARFCGHDDAGKFNRDCHSRGGGNPGNVLAAGGPRLFGNFRLTKYQRSSNRILLKARLYCRSHRSRFLKECGSDDGVQKGMWLWLKAKGFPHQWNRRLFPFPNPIEPVQLKACYFVSRPAGRPEDLYFANGFRITQAGFQSQA
jgi:hypothetical protein